MPTIRILTWNCRGTNQATSEAILKFAQDHDIDIAVLQETEKECTILKAYFEDEGVDADIFSNSEAADPTDLQIHPHPKVQSSSSRAQWYGAINFNTDNITITNNGIIKYTSAPSDVESVKSFLIRPILQSDTIQKDIKKHKKAIEKQQKKLYKPCIVHDTNQTATATSSSGTKIKIRFTEVHNTPPGAGIVTGDVLADMGINRISFKTSSAPSISRKPKIDESVYGMLGLRRPWKLTVNINNIRMNLLVFHAAQGGGSGGGVSSGMDAIPCHELLMASFSWQFPGHTILAGDFNIHSSQVKNIYSNCTHIPSDKDNLTHVVGRGFNIQKVVLPDQELQKLKDHSDHWPLVFDVDV